MKILINRSDSPRETLLSLPMAKLLKEKFPNSKIYFLISEESLDIVKSNPYIDEIIIYHRSARFYHKIKQIFSIFRDIKPTHYFYVGGGYLPNFISWILGVDFRGGIKSRWHTYLFLNKGIRQKRSMVTMHEMEYNLNLLSPLDINYNYKEFQSYIPEIFLSQDELENFNNSFVKEIEALTSETNKKYIFIHPSMTINNLNWSSRNYARLLLKFEQRFPSKYLYIISHTDKDHVFLQGMKEFLSRKENSHLLKRIIYMNRKKYGYRYYMSILSNALLFVGPSSGATQLAAVLGVPVVSVFSPIKIQSALRWAPLSRNQDFVKVLVPDVICGETKKCSLRECPYYECMGKIEVEDVFKQALNYLN
jgi:ADP-heptose:LPS heptosyltransferase